MKKSMLAAALLLISSAAMADYRVQVNDHSQENAIAFESCAAGTISVLPGDRDGTYITLTCDDAPSEVNWHEATTNPNAKIEELYIRWSPDSDMERLDCYLEFFIHERPGETGTINVTCGAATAIFANGFNYEAPN